MNLGIESDETETELTDYDGIGILKQNGIMHWNILIL